MLLFRLGMQSTICRGGGWDVQAWIYTRACLTSLCRTPSYCRQDAPSGHGLSLSCCPASAQWQLPLLCLQSSLAGMHIAAADDGSRALPACGFAAFD